MTHQELTDLLPTEFMWGDSLQPHHLQEILLAATAKADESHKFFTDCLQNQVEILKEANTEAETEITELREGLLSAKDELIAQCEEALKAAYPVLQDYSLSNPMHFYKNVRQDPQGVHKAFGITNEALAAIAKHKKEGSE